MLDRECVDPILPKVSGFILRSGSVGTRTTTLSLRLLSFRENKREGGLVRGRDNI